MAVSAARERVTLTGVLDPDAFVPWIARHADRLGVPHHVVSASPERIEIEVSGEADLIDMLAIGCSLGPIAVWVESVDRRLVEADARPVDNPVLNA